MTSKNSAVENVVKGMVDVMVDLLGKGLFDAANQTYATMLLSFDRAAVDAAIASSAGVDAIASASMSGAVIDDETAAAELDAALAELQAVRERVAALSATLDAARIAAIDAWVGQSPIFAAWYTAKTAKTAKTGNIAPLRDTNAAASHTHNVSENAGGRETLRAQPGESVAGVGRGRGNARYLWDTHYTILSDWGDWTLFIDSGTRKAIVTSLQFGVSHGATVFTDKDGKDKLENAARKALVYAISANVYYGLAGFNPKSKVNKMWNSSLYHPDMTDAQLQFAFVGVSLHGVNGYEQWGIDDTVPE